MLILWSENALELSFKYRNTDALYVSYAKYLNENAFHKKMNKKNGEKSQTDGTHAIARKIMITILSLKPRCHIQRFRRRKRKRKLNFVVERTYSVSVAERCNIKRKLKTKSASYFSVFPKLLSANCNHRRFVFSASRSFACFTLYKISLHFTKSMITSSSINVNFDFLLVLVLFKMKKKKTRKIRTVKF